MLVLAEETSITLKVQNTEYKYFNWKDNKLVSINTYNKILIFTYKYSEKLKHFGLANIAISKFSFETNFCNNLKDKLIGASERDWYYNLHTVLDPLFSMSGITLSIYYRPFDISLNNVGDV